MMEKWFWDNSGLIPQVQSACRPLHSIETTLIKVTTEVLSALDCFVLLLVHLLFLILIPKTKKNIQSKLSAMRDKNCIAARVSNDA